MSSGGLFLFLPLFFWVKEKWQNDFFTAKESGNRISREEKKQKNLLPKKVEIGFLAQRKSKK